MASARTARSRRGALRSPFLRGAGPEAPGDRRRGGPWPLRLLAGVVTVAVAVGVVGVVVVVRNRIEAARTSLVIFGDSQVVESQDYFTDAARKAGTRVSLQIWSGTAPCNWLGAVPKVIHDVRPRIAVFSFSGNEPDCENGRELVTAYREDMSTMIDQLVSAGAQVRLVVAPVYRSGTVDARGLTPLGELWEELAHDKPATSVVRADLAVTDHGRYAQTLPCEAGEPCGPDGRILVRSPDGVHFCPNLTGPGGPCDVYSSGARRYGEAMARGVLETPVRDGAV